VGSDGGCIALITYISVYLVVGLVFMMLVLANVYDIPELNFGNHFYMRNDVTSPDVHEDEEHRKLRASGEGAPEQTKYGVEGTVGKRVIKGSKSGGRQHADDQETLVDE